MTTASDDRDPPGAVLLVPSDADFDEALRRALRRVADCVEPAGDGLTRIFRRLAAPWPVRQMALLVTDCVDVAQLIAIWLQPMSERAISVRSAASGSVREALRRLPSRVATAVAWLRPALVAAVTAVAVMTGTVALSQTVARIELSNNRTAGISPSAVMAPIAGGRWQSPASVSGPALRPAAPTPQTPPAGGGAAHHPCAATKCSSGSSAAAAPTSSAQPTASPSASGGPAHRHPGPHHHPHQRHGPHHQRHGPHHQPHSPHH